MIDLAHDLFVLQAQGKSAIAYSPLRGAAFRIDPKWAPKLNRYIAGQEDALDSLPVKLTAHLERLAGMEVSQPARLTLGEDVVNTVILLTDDCNLACTYCYAQSTRSKRMLQRSVVEQVIDTAFRRQSSRLRFTFLGGGEPLLAWETIRHAVEKIRCLEKGLGVHAGITLTTNGTLIEEAHASFLAKHGVRVSVSFEILPGVQDSQRPFASTGAGTTWAVRRGVRLLMDYGVPLRFRSTITHSSVRQMPGMIEYCIKEYPSIRHIQLEPVTLPGVDSASFLEQYGEWYLRARRLGMAHGIDVRNSIMSSFASVQDRFCPGEFCITPHGSIVSCHRVADPSDWPYEHFRYGEVGASVLLDPEATLRVLEHADAKPSRCGACPARWHCAGGCTMLRTTSDPGMMAAHCRLVRTLLVAFLEERLDRADSVFDKDAVHENLLSHATRACEAQGEGSHRQYGQDC